jgi:superfamily II DNA or RNA helicase
MLYKGSRMLTLLTLGLFHAEVGGIKEPDSIKRTMLSAGWCLDGDQWNELVPRAVYLTGELWPKYDRAASRPPEDIQAANQARELLDAIQPAVFEDIDNMSPRDSWIPLEIIAAWMRDSVNRRGPVHIERRNGLVLPRDVKLGEIADYLTTANALRKEQNELEELTATLAESKDEKKILREQTPELSGLQWQQMSPDEMSARHAKTARKRELDKEMRRLEKSIALRNAKIKDIEQEAEGGLTSESIWVLGWLNHDMSTFKPPYSKDEKIDEVRIRYAKEWQSSFKAWLGSHPARRDEIRDVYNRTFRGFVQPVYEPEPLDIARYRPVNRSLHPWQVAGARRILANRGGLLAFDVGVGKTDTALAVIGKARQEGWVKRPVILVPTSIVWKWYKDIKRLYPDYRIGVVGSKSRKLTGKSEQARQAKVLLQMGRIDQDGYERAITTSEPDTPEDRAAVWTALQAGQLDVVILSYDALQRTRMNEAAVVAYAEHSEAIQRAVEMQIRNTENRKKLSERAKAVKEHGMRAWIAQRMEINKGWDYDPGIAWDDIGIDMMVVDEAAAFKNLYLPEKREFGIPKFMGNAGDGSKRAWQLDFRLAAIRRKTGGAGVVLLTATPAKNSPLEYYNLIQYIDPQAFSRRGIGNPEQFIDRYLKIEPQNVIAVTGDTAIRSAVIGFLHLGELREIIFRYGEFASVPVINKRYPLAKIELPKLSFPESVVIMDDEQEEKYSSMLAEIEKMIEDEDTSNLLGYMARLSLIAVHAQLDEGYGWNTALNGGISRRKVTQNSLDGWIERGWSIDDKPAKGKAKLDEVFDDDDDEELVAIKCDLPKPSYSSPKFELVATNVWAKKDCGHIIFCESVATHQWIREVLVKRGIKRDRIACLNAIASPEAADRQRIAEDFNGDPDASREPLYDVVIANSVAYEGIDLQRRTCSIHHVDFPWTPADLEQRNGRGYRQGNTLATFEIFYYRADRSLDGFRYNSISGKAQWQDELIYGESRETNNPGAQSTLTPDQVLIAISRNPSKTIATLEKVKAEAEAAARKQVAINASKTLLQANARMREARSTDDPHMAARLRGEAKDRVLDLQKIDVQAWPWARWLGKIAEVDYMVPADGQAPVYEGLRVGKPSNIYPDQIDFYEFGRHIPGAEGGGVIGMRGLGAPTWMARTMSGVTAPVGSEQFGLRPEQLELGGSSWPDDSVSTAANIRAELTKRGGKFDWESFGWRLASDAFLTQWWARFRQPIMKAIADSTLGEEYLYPIDSAGVLTLKDREAVDELIADNELDGLLPPTLAGFDHYLQLAPASRLSFQDLDAVARFWWYRPFPRGLLTAAARMAKMSRGELNESLPRPARDYWHLPHPDRRKPQEIDDRPSTHGGLRRRVVVR